MIKIICIGKIKEQYLNNMISDYKKRVNKYHKLEIIELLEQASLEKEANSILNKVSEKSEIILCDLNGKEITSEHLSNMINEIFIYKSEIVFIIGSSNGVADIIKNKANKCISFGKVTYPHGLFRGLLLEQIYRSFKIMNNESYHK